MLSFFNKKRLSFVLVLLAGTLWGCVGLFTTPLRQMGINNISIIAVRSTLTAIFLLIFLLLYNRKLFKIRLKDIWIFLGMGIVSFTFFNLCYLKAMELTSLGTACTLMYTAPIFIMLLSAILFKEKITPLKLICLVMAVAGCVMISGGDNVTPLGFTFGIGSGIGYGLYSIFGVYALRKYSFFTSTFYAFLFSALFLAPFCDWKTTTDIMFTRLDGFLLLVGIAIIITVVPYIIYTCGLKNISAGTASVIACVEPLVAALVGMLVFGQMPGILSWIGIGIILLAVILLSRAKK